MSTPANDNPARSELSATGTELPRYHLPLPHPISAPSPPSCVTYRSLNVMVFLSEIRGTDRPFMWQHWNSRSRSSAKTADGGWRETIKIVGQALILAMIVRIFFYQPFNIPSGSMKETLLVGDYLFASKLS
jgi:hypothetical protein